MTFMVRQGSKVILQILGKCLLYLYLSSSRRVIGLFLFSPCRAIADVHCFLLIPSALSASRILCLYCLSFLTNFLACVYFYQYCTLTSS